MRMSSERHRLFVRQVCVVRCSFIKPRQARSHSARLSQVAYHMPGGETPASRFESNGGMLLRDCSVAGWPPAPAWGKSTSAHTTAIVKPGSRFERHQRTHGSGCWMCHSRSYAATRLSSARRSLPLGPLGGRLTMSSSTSSRHRATSISP
jgi:hypothetical protein